MSRRAAARVGPKHVRGPRRDLWRVAVACALLLCASGARGQSTAGGPDAAPSVRLYVLADTVALGEAFDVAVAADHAPGVQTLFPEVPRDRTAERGPLLALGDAEATDMQRFAPIARGGVQTDSAVYRALAFAADSARVSLSVGFASGGGDTLTVASNTALVRVERLTPGPEAEPEPMGPPFEFPSPVPVMILLGTLALAVAAAVGWGLWRLWRRTPRTQRTPRALPYPEAIARLDALAADPPTPEASQAWFVELSDALRTYLERRLDVRAMERTTREIDADLASRLPDEARAALRGALRVADRVKFADLRPGPEASGDALARAREGIEASEAHVVVLEEAARRAAEAEAAARAALSRKKTAPPTTETPEADTSERAPADA
ncbi:MAG: hypothetical protein AAFQ43_01320 [Bacteroidota bacterium]